MGKYYSQLGNNIIFALFSLVCIILCCEGIVPLNDNPPAYIKSLSAYKEGDGIVVYFILADSKMAMTTSDGYISLTISETELKWSSWQDKYIEEKTELFSKSTQIRKESFVRTKIGQGPFERNAIICPLGRISYSSFSKHPEGFSGIAELEFITNDNRSLTADETIIF